MKPFIQAFPEMDITTIVMDEGDFHTFIDGFRGTILISEEQITALKAAKHLPLMKHGTVTAKFFKQYNVKTSMLSAIVRGHGVELAKRLLDSNVLKGCLSDIH